MAWVQVLADALGTGVLLHPHQAKPALPGPRGPDGAYEFLAQYAAAGGPAGALDEIAVRQVIRQRLWSEVRWANGGASRSVTRDTEDLAYTRAQVAAFWALRPSG